MISLWYPVRLFRVAGKQSICIFLNTGQNRLTSNLDNCINQLRLSAAFLAVNPVKIVLWAQNFRALWDFFGANQGDNEEMEWVLKRHTSHFRAFTASHLHHIHLLCRNNFRMFPYDTNKTRYDVNECCFGKSSHGRCRNSLKTSG